MRKIRKINMFFGEKWWSLKSWRRYTLFGKLDVCTGFHIGPIMFWDGK